MTTKNDKIRIIDPLVAENIEKFRTIVQEVTGCHKDYCTTKHRDTEFVKPRQILCFVIKRIYPLMSTSAISQIVSNQDHCTFINSMKTITNIIDTENQTRVMVENIITKCVEAMEPPKEPEKPSLKLQMAINFIEDFFRTGKYDEMVSGSYSLNINRYVWNDDDTIAKLQGYLNDKGIKSKYNGRPAMKKTIIINKTNFL